MTEAPSGFPQGRTALLIAHPGHELRVHLFVGLAAEVAAALVADDVTCLVADAAEGYDPSHDVCRYLADHVRPLRDALRAYAAAAQR